MGLGDLLGGLLGYGQETTDKKSGLGGIAPWIDGLSSLAGIGGQLYSNSQNQEQLSNQWNAQFQYQQQQDAEKMALAREELAAKLQIAQMGSGGASAAAGIAAAAQNKRTLSDMYANYLNDLGNVRKDQLAGYNQLGQAMAGPYLSRKV